MHDFVCKMLCSVKGLFCDSNVITSGSAPWTFLASQFAHKNMSDAQNKKSYSVVQSGQN